MALVLVGVHRTAEDDHGVGAFGRPAAELHRPLDELVPAVLTASAKTPGPTVGPCVTARTRTARAFRYFFGFAGMTTRTVLLLSAAAARFAERHVTPNVGVQGTVPAVIAPRTFR